MNKKTNIFQVVLLLILGFSLVIAVLIFAGFLPGYERSGSAQKFNLTMWGPLPAGVMNPTLKTLDKRFSVSYQQKDPATYERDLVDALARGQGPDLFIFDDSMIIRYDDLISPLPFTSVSVRDFQDLFVDGAQIFVSKTGIIAMPLVVDPLVLYYNKDLYINSAILTPPKNWSAFIVNHQKLNQVTNQGFIEQSGLAFGSFENINNAKAILTSLFIQVGVPIVAFSETENEYVTRLQGFNNGAVSSLDFFARFTTPGRAEYSWNNSLPEAKTYFTRGDLAHYAGFASELDSLKKANPNLNLDVMLFPAISESKPSTAYGRFIGVAVAKNSQQQFGAFSLLVAMVDRTFADLLAKEVNLVPVRRDLLVADVEDPFQSIFYRAGFTAKGWFDPDPTLTTSLFSTAVRNVVSGVNSSSASLSALNNQIDLLIKK